MVLVLASSAWAAWGTESVLSGSWHGVTGGRIGSTAIYAACDAAAFRGYTTTTPPFGNWGSADTSSDTIGCDTEGIDLHNSLYFFNASGGDSCFTFLQYNVDPDDGSNGACVASQTEISTSPVSAFGVGGDSDNYLLALAEGDPQVVKMWRCFDCGSTDIDNWTGPTTIVTYATDDIVYGVDVSFADTTQDCYFIIDVYDDSDARREVHIYSYSFISPGSSLEWTFNGYQGPVAFQNGGSQGDITALWHNGSNYQISECVNGMEGFCDDPDSHNIASVGAGDTVLSASLYDAGGDSYVYAGILLDNASGSDEVRVVNDQGTEELVTTLSGTDVGLHSVQVFESETTDYDKGIAFSSGASDSGGYGEEEAGLLPELPPYAIILIVVVVIVAFFTVKPKAKAKANKAKAAKKKRR